MIKAHAAGYSHGGHRGAAQRWKIDPFNRITGQRRAIVGDEPGITRDRIQGQRAHDGRHFELIDTGGIVVHDSEYIPSQILKQAQVALDTARTSYSWWMGARKSRAPIATWRRCCRASASPSRWR